MRELQFGKLEPRVKGHLTKVYTAMGLSLMTCAAGSYIHMAGFFTAGILSTLACLGCVLALVGMDREKYSHSTRFSVLMGAAALCGINQGPLVELSVAVDPALVMTAFLATSLVFVAFTLSALLSNDRKFLALGGVLFSGLSWLILFGFLNIFFRSPLIYELKLYLGLALFCGYVLYDTQVIVEKCRQGDDDYIGHCLLLFLDFVNIFRHILVLLTNKEIKKDRKKD